MNARAVLRALGVVVFIVVGMTILIVPATFGLYVDGQNQRMGPESAPTMIFLAIGLAAVASGFSQIDTRAKRAPGSRPRPPLVPTLVQVLLTGPLLAAGIAAATLLWRVLSVPDGGGPGLWNDYLHSPLAMATLILAVWSTTNLGRAIGVVLGGATDLATSCLAAAALLIAVLAAPAGFLWLMHAEPGWLLIALLMLSVPLSMAVCAAGVWLRTRVTIAA